MFWLDWLSTQLSLWCNLMEKVYILLQSQNEKEKSPESN